VVYGWREGAKWGFFAPLYSLAGPQNRTYFDLSDSFYWKPGFREHRMPEAQFPGTPLLGSS
jgi:hypothetical protein